MMSFKQKIRWLTGNDVVYRVTMITLWIVFIVGVFQLGDATWSLVDQASSINCSTGVAAEGLNLSTG